MGVIKRNTKKLAWDGTSTVLMKTYGKRSCANCGKQFLRLSSLSKYCGRTILKTGCAHKKHLEKTRRAFKKHYEIHHTEYRARVKVRRLGVFINKKIPQKPKTRQVEKYKNTPEARERRRNSPNFPRGETHARWKGGITPVNLKIRNSSKYKQWRESVFRRDSHTCKMCGKRGGNMNADHIKSFAHFPELRFEISNGRTLCVPCHKKTDTWGYKSR